MNYTYIDYVKGTATRNFVIESDNGYQVEARLVESPKGYWDRLVTHPDGHTFTNTMTDASCLALVLDALQRGLTVRLSNIEDTAASPATDNTERTAEQDTLKRAQDILQRRQQVLHDRLLVLINNPRTDPLRSNTKLTPEQEYDLIRNWSLLEALEMLSREITLL
jgi:hypothetical protein